MKYVIVAYCFISLLIPQSNLILWDSDQLIQWEDFKGIPPNDKGVKVAVSYVKIKVKRKSYLVGDLPSYSVQSYFDSERSWTVTKDTNSLIHERLHFDIAEVFARKIRCEIQTLKGQDEKDSEKYKIKYKALLERHKEMQAKYDYEVYFNEIKQEEWISRIAKELEELKEYEYIPNE